MSSRVEIWLDTPTGSRLAHLDKFISAECIPYIENDYGVIAVELPNDYDQYIRLDGMVEFWLDGYLEAIGFVRKWDFYEDENGVEKTIIVAYTGNYILTSRIVAYAAGTAQASMTDQADDMLKEIVNDNLMSDATGARNIVTLNLTKQANLADGQSITKSFSWRPLLNVCQDIAAASKEAGTAVYFEFVPKLISSETIGFEFQTFTGQRGINHGSTSNDPVYFGKNWGNLFVPRLSQDHTEEINFVYAGGQGEGSARNVNEVSDSTRYNMSPWNRREGFADARNESSENGVTAQGYEKLNEGRPDKIFTAEIVSTPAAQYRVHWGFGDIVTAEYRGVIYDARISGGSITVSSTGEVKISGKLKVED
jgi:hypothetical protein